MGKLRARWARVTDSRLFQTLEKLDFMQSAAQFVLANKGWLLLLVAPVIAIAGFIGGAIALALGALTAGWFIVIAVGGVVFAAAPWFVLRPRGPIAIQHPAARAAQSPLESSVRDDPALVAFEESRSSRAKRIDGTAKRLAEEYIERHPEMETEFYGRSIDELVKQVDDYRLRGESARRIRVDMWLLAKHPPQHITGSAAVEMGASKPESHATSFSQSNSVFVADCKQLGGSTSLSLRRIGGAWMGLISFQEFACLVKDPLGFQYEAATVIPIGFSSDGTIATVYYPSGFSDAPSTPGQYEVTWIRGGMLGITSPEVLARKRFTLK